MAATKRNFYALEFKVGVLDAIETAGGVTAAARARQLDPGLVYSWSAKEKELRKQLAAELRTKNGAKGGRTALALVAEPSTVKAKAGNSKAEKAKVEKAKVEKAHPDGPKMVVRGMGEWLRKVVREEVAEELPAALLARLETLVDARVTARVEALVEQKFERMLDRGKRDG